MIITNIYWDFSGSWLKRWCNEPEMQLLQPAYLNNDSLKAHFDASDNTIEHIELEKNNLGVVVYDLSFDFDVTVRWQSAFRYFGCYFDLSDLPALQQIYPAPTAVQYLISYGSSHTCPEFKACAGKRFKGISILISEEMLYRLLSQFCDGDIKNYVEYFNWDTFQGIAAINNEMLGILYDIADSSAVTNSVLRKMHLYGNIHRLLSCFIAHILRAEPIHINLSADKAQLIRFDKMIMAGRLSCLPSITAAAAELYMSASKFKCLFKEIFGATYHSYYREKKLQQAMLLLKGGCNSVGEVTGKLGYKSASTFSQIFRQRFGIQPGEALCQQIH
jgi:AraC-like DNA-binding protein